MYCCKREQLSILSLFKRAVIRITGQGVERLVNYFNTFKVILIYYEIFIHRMQTELMQQLQKLDD